MIRIPFTPWLLRAGQVWRHSRSGTQIRILAVFWETAPNRWLVRFRTTFSPRDATALYEGLASALYKSYTLESLHAGNASHASDHR